MGEKWAIAMEEGSQGLNRYLWMRNSSGDIAVFPSEHQARLWILTDLPAHLKGKDFVFFRITSKNDS